MFTRKPHPRYRALKSQLKKHAEAHVSPWRRPAYRCVDLKEPMSIGPWLKTPNEAFFNSTPLQVIERGEQDRIWRMIHQLETGEPE